MSWKSNKLGHYTKNLREYKGRHFFAVFIIVLLIAAAAGRLFFLQVLRHDYYSALAKRQQGFQRTLEPKRGDIYFKTKDGEPYRIASTKIGALLYLDMRILKDPEAVFAKLNNITPVDRVVFDKIIKKAGDPYEILKRRISMEKADKISALSVPGVRLQEEKWREYLGGKTAAHVLGFVSEYEDGKGKYGIESWFDNFLRGSSGKISGDKDGRGFFIALANLTEIEAESGRDILLTFEPNVQREIEKELAALKEKWSPLSGGAIVLEPKTGRILALGAFPEFDPNSYQKEKSFDTFLNPFVEKIFELGSVFKPLTMAAALNEGVLTPETTYVDEGEVRIGGRVIKNFDEKARGVRTMTQVLEESLNTGAVFAMQKLGGEKLKEYFIKYGLKEKTGIELPGELKGNLSNLDSGREIEYATASFGQGLAVTPLEFAMAISSLANGGKLMKPILLDNGASQVVRETIKPETSETITRMLVKVVDEVLAGGKVKMDRYSIAAKTGTAQIPASRFDGGRSGGYSEYFMHSFFGYFPAYDPKFLIFMFLERPIGVKYASQSLSGSFRSLVEFLINYYTIPPDR